MRNRRRMAYQEEEIERLREENRGLESEIKAVEIELERAKNRLADKEQEYELLREGFENYIKKNAAQAKQTLEAGQQCGSIIEELKKLKKVYEKEAERQIAEIRRENKTLN